MKMLSKQIVAKPIVSITGLYPEVTEVEELSRFMKLGKTFSVTFRKYIRPTLGIGVVSYISMIFMSIIIAYVGSGGYNLLEHTISELGLKLMTPLPNLFNSACMLAGIISIPYYFLLRKKVTSWTQDSFLLKATMYIGFIGAIGYFFVGVFSLERSGPFQITHEIFAGVAFVGFVAAIILFSVYIIRFQDRFLKAFGIFGLIFPVTFLILYCIFVSPILEWLLLISILIFSVPSSLWALLK